jgi:large subunit ribosomal protein L25
MQLVLECKKRPEGSKPNALRREGMIPAVLYGHNGSESLDLAVEAKVAERLLRDASLNNSLIDIKLTDDAWTGKALLREVQTHPWKGFLYHLSFFSVASQSSLEVSVPLRIVGEDDCPGMKVGGGSLDVSMSDLQVRCAPDLIPETIDVDIAGMNVGDFKHVRDLTMPDGVVPLEPADNVVVTVLGARG